MINWLFNNKNLCDVIMSIATVILSITAIVISIVTYHMQKEFNKNSVKPYFYFDLIDLPDRIAIKLSNYGVGVGIIKEALFLSKNNGGPWSTLLDAVEGIGERDNCLKKDRGIWKRYMESYRDFPVAPKSSCVLLEIEKRYIDLKVIRNILKEIEVSISYVDIYQNQQRLLIYDFEYFDRRNEKEYFLTV